MPRRSQPHDGRSRHPQSGSLASLFVPMPTESAPKRKAVAPAPTLPARPTTVRSFAELADLAGDAA